MEKKTVLVVDDSAISLKHVQSILKDDYSLACTKSGSRALDYLIGHKPDLILLDVKMPEMSGVELFERIKQVEKLADIPIVFLTGDEEGDAERLQSQGILRKPAEPDKLLDMIKSLI